MSGADRAGLVARLHGQARADWAALTVALADSAGAVVAVGTLAELQQPESTRVHAPHCSG